VRGWWPVWGRALGPGVLQHVLKIGGEGLLDSTSPSMVVLSMTGAYAAGRARIARPYVPCGFDTKYIVCSADDRSSLGPANTRFDYLVSCIFCARSAIQHFLTSHLATASVGVSAGGLVARGEAG
jgi:hypothetical protein